MSLFDKKEEVINIELTQFGKHKLSIGEFQPEYYGFYDDEIIYDTEWAGYSENTSEIKTRILEDIKFKPFYSISSDSKKELCCLENPLGTSETLKEYMPSWDINVLMNEFTNIILGNPSADMQITYYSKLKKNSENRISNLEVLYTTSNYKDGYYLEMSRKPIILEFNMENSKEDYFEKNFDLEIFEIEDGVERKLTNDEIISKFEILLDSDIRNLDGKLILGLDNDVENIYDEFSTDRGNIC